MRAALHGLDDILCIHSIFPSYRMAPRCMDNALDSPPTYMFSEPCACFSKAKIKTIQFFMIVDGEEDVINRVMRTAILENLKLDAG